MQGEVLMPFTLGLDLGQAQDPTAAIVMESHGAADRQIYDVRHIEQFALGTSYPAIVTKICRMLARDPLSENCRLVIDHSGVGRPIYDMFVEAKLRPIGITITGGSGWHRETVYQWHVAKVLLTGSVQKALQSGRLRIGATLPHAKTLQRELRDFRVKISKAANETYEAREGAHDDIVLALAIALFSAETPVYRFAPIGQ